jgi:GNAT superfamily N-acetyltransferase
VTSPRFRIAGPDDSGQVARLHADSWRRSYRGVYSDAFLDADVVEDRLAVWAARLAAPSETGAGTGTWTLLAEEGDGRLAGFVHVVFDNDEEWGSLVDNLHVVHDRQRSGIGRVLLARAADAVLEQAAAKSVYLWVLELNTKAQGFYRACGGDFAGHKAVSAPGGVPGRLVGAPRALRIAWPDPAPLASLIDR